jgi:hypothetical protein
MMPFARAARKGMRTESGGYRRDHLRALAQRVEVDAKEVRIMGSKSALLRTLVAGASAKTAGFCSARFCTEVATPAELPIALQVNGLRYKLRYLRPLFVKANFGELQTGSRRRSQPRASLATGDRLMTAKQWGGTILGAVFLFTAAYIFDEGEYGARGPGSRLVTRADDPGTYWTSEITLIFLAVCAFARGWSD